MSEPRPRPILTVGRGAAAVLAAAAVSWLVGALPWLVEGLRLPVSTAWPSVRPEDVVRVALPLGEYQLGALIVTTVVGASASMLAVRAIGLPAWTGAVGAAIGLGAGLTQSVHAAHPLLADSAEARLLLGALIAVAVAGTIAGLVAGHLVPRRSTGGAMSVAVLACLLHAWLVDLVVIDLADGRLEVWTARHSQWLLGLLLGAALWWTGWRPVRLLLRWPLVIAVSWVVTAGMTAVGYIAAYARRGTASGDAVREVLAAGVDVFVQALTPGNRGLMFVWVGLLVGLAAVGTSRMRAGTTTPVAEEARP